jgi:DnaJ-class molecular chaperone
MADWIEIHVPCDTCDGSGECSHYQENLQQCPDCAGEGYVVRGDFYNSMKKAEEDYPTAIRMIVIR